MNSRPISSVLTTLGLFLCAFTAHAGTLHGSFDPSFGGSGSLGNLGYRGEVTFSVPDGCYATTGAKAVPADCSPVALTGVTLDLYNAASHPTPIPSDFLQVITFSSLDLTDIATSIFVQFVPSEGRNDVTGLRTNPIGPSELSIQANSSLVGIYEGPLWLTFNYVAPLPTSTTLLTLPSFVTTSALLHACRGYTSDTDEDGGDGTDHDTDGEPVSCSFADSTQGANPATVKLTSFPSVPSVPEPSTVALIFGALLAGWSIRRQRRIG